MAYGERVRAVPRTVSNLEAPASATRTRAGRHVRRARGRAESFPVDGLRFAVVRLEGGLRRVWVTGCGLLVAQLVGLVAWSWHLWTRFDLTSDMATFAQAFEQVGTGHLDPYLTTFAHHYPHYGYPFYQSHLELLLWPLALLYPVFRTAFVLLVVQDVALVGAGALALRWGLEILARRWPPGRRGAPTVGAAAVVLLVASPWTYWSASFDFHFQPLGACFALGAGRDLWAGRRRLWAWVAPVLACGDVAATYVLGLGLAGAVAGRRTRRPGIALVVVALGWLAVVGLVHSGKGSSLAAGYGYLAGHPVSDGLSGMAAVVWGMVSHPARPLHVLGQRLGSLAQYAAGAGVLGVVSVIGGALFVVVLGANALNSTPVYVSHIGAFQNVCAAFFLAVGSVTTVTWVARRRAHRAPRVATVLGVLVALPAVVVGALVVPQARGTFATVGRSTAGELAVAAASIPGDSEVVASQGVVGRFGARRWVYPYIGPAGGGQTVPVYGDQVYFVMVSTAGVELAPPADTEAAVAQLRALGARTVVDGHGVVVLAWRRPADLHLLTLRPASPGS